jgi:hypothetical protein
VTRNGKAGRLDLLLEDPDPEAATRYEVEIQLGATDEPHIIRTLEYWDIERKRYPQYEHCAVMDVKIPQSEEVDAKLVEAGLETLEYSKRANAYPIWLGDKSDIEKHAALLKDLMHRKRCAAPT